MSVRNGNAQALSRKGRLRCVDDPIALNRAPDFQRLLFRLFFFSADVGDHIIENLREGFKGLTGSGNCLICTDKRTLNAKLFIQREQRGNIALERAVGLNADKAPFGSQAFSLSRDDGGVLRVQLRNDHRHIGRSSMRAVVRHDRAFRFRIRLF